MQCVSVQTQTLIATVACPIAQIYTITCRDSTLCHACGWTWTEVGEPAGQAVWVGGVVPQQLIDAREGWTIINTVCGGIGMFHLHRQTYDECLYIIENL